jgi:hypothetical protein
VIAKIFHENLHKKLFYVILQLIDYASREILVENNPLMDTGIVKKKPYRNVGLFLKIIWLYYCFTILITSVVHISLNFNKVNNC